MHRVILFFALISSLICCNKEEDLDFSISLVDTFPLIISEFQENIVIKSATCLYFLMVRFHFKNLI